MPVVVMAMCKAVLSSVMMGIQRQEMDVVMFVSLKQVVLILAV